MAESATVPTTVGDRPLPVWPTIVIARIRSQWAYRASFVLNTLGSFLTGLLEFVEIYVLLYAAPVFGGLTLPEATLVFAVASLGFGFADLVFGQMDSLPNFIRQGQLESFLTKPLALVPQMITSSFQLRRLARVVFGVVALVVALQFVQVAWTPVAVLVMAAGVVFGFAIYSALFVLAGGCQFWLVNGSEFTNAFVYGGKYVGQLPASVMLTPVRVFFTFVVPATVTAYLPVLLVLDRPGPEFLPTWLGWLLPLFAVWSWVLAILVWRAGVRKYTGAGG